jgi:hypothetical protein
VIIVGLALGGCGGGVQHDVGLDALLQVADAQFFRGPFPKEAGGPSVGALRTVSQQLRVGQTNRALSGSADKTAVSVAFGLADDLGYWVRPMGGADPILTDQLSFDANLAFSRFIPPGEHAVLVAASDASGHFGPASPLSFTFIDLNALPAADLTVSLTWDVDADLDLHVVQPDGVEIWARKVSAYEPPVVGPVDQAAADAAGHLDFDSNSMCRLDGRRAENVVFEANAPSGHYLARVDTFSLCGQAAAHWTLTVTHQGTVLAQATGTALPVSTRFPHERGAGVLAADFTIP